jgi:SRP-independent targeting protein 2/TMEM208
VHAILRYGVRLRSVGTWSVIGSAVCLGCLAFAYRMLQSAAEPTYGPSNELVDGGADLSKASPTLSLAKDLLWACVIVLPIVGATDYGWLLASVVPMAGAWQGYTVYLAPLLSMSKAPQPQEGDTAQKSRQDRAAKRAERRRVKYK